MARLSGRQELSRLVADLGRIPPELRRALRPEIRRTVKPLQERIQANASWSTRIPKATKIGISLGRTPGVRLYVDPKKAPHAVHYENRGRAGSFRHPVFGNRRVWAVQEARPFFRPAVEGDVPRIADELADVVIDVARRHGFR